MQAALNLGAFFAFVLGGIAYAASKGAGASDHVALCVGFAVGGLVVLGTLIVISRNMKSSTRP